MSLRKFDKPDYYVAGDAGSVWTLVASVGLASPGRFTGSYFSMSNTTLEETLDAQGTWIVGFAIRIPALPASDSIILRLRDDASEQDDVRITSSGTIRVTRNGTTLGTSTFALAANVWYYMETKIVISDAAGSYEVRIDGSNKVSASSQDTKDTSNATANKVRIQAPSSMPWHCDDIYICDGAGSANNNFLGECRVGTLLPDGAGASTTWTPSAGSNYQNVDDAAPDGDTTYNSSSTVGQIDLFTFGNTSLTGTVAGVQILMYARKDDAGTREIRAITRRGGSNYNGATKTLASSFQYHKEIQEVDPSTSVAWTTTNLNGAEFGVEVVT